MGAVSDLESLSTKRRIRGNGDRNLRARDGNRYLSLMTGN